MLEAESIGVVDRRGRPYLRCLQGPHDRGTRFRFRVMRCWASGECGSCEERADGGVGVMVSSRRIGQRKAPIGSGGGHQ